MLDVMPRIAIVVSFAIVTCAIVPARGQTTPPCEGCILSSQLPTTRFHAVFSPRPYDVTGGPRYGEFTFAGPRLDSMILLPEEISEVARDPISGQYFGIGGHETYFLDLATRQATLVSVPAYLDDVFTMGLAFDESRRRLLVSDLVGSGYIHAYSPDSDTWSIVADVNDRDFTAMAYDPASDRIYGLSCWAPNYFELTTYTGTGEFIGDQILDMVAPIPLDPYDRDVQLLAVEGLLALLVPNGGDVPLLYAIEPEANSILLVVPVPEPSGWLIAFPAFAAAWWMRRRLPKR